MFREITRPSLVCDGTSRPTHPSLYHNHRSLEVYKFAPGSYSSLQQSDDKKLELAVYPLEDENTDYFLEVIDYFAMPADVEPLE